MHIIIFNHIVFDLFHLIFKFPKFTKKTKLSTRELEILAYLKEGFTNKQIAQKLFISEFTVKTHRKNIMSKMEANNIVGLLKKY